MALKTYEMGSKWRYNGEFLPKNDKNRFAVVPHVTSDSWGSAPRPLSVTHLRCTSLLTT